MAIQNFGERRSSDPRRENQKSDIYADLICPPPVPDDPVFGLTAEFKKDQRAEKVNLLAGVYRDEFGRTLPFKIVTQVEIAIAERRDPKGYLQPEGDNTFCERARNLLLGANSSLDIISIQSAGGTGALRLGAELLREMGKELAAFSAPTWSNHFKKTAGFRERGIFAEAGFNGVFYPYYDVDSKKLNLAGMIEFLNTLDQGSVVVLQGVCHNPTGLDPSKDEWQEILRVLEERKHIPFVDIAYQGFGDGLVEDSWFARELLNSGIGFILFAQSFSKNFGLYQDRVGALHIAVKDFEPSTRERILPTLIVKAREFYSNPPAHGAKVVSEILGSDSLRPKWEEELNGIRQRIKTLRLDFVRLLTEQFEKEGINFDLSHIEAQKGMFSFTGFPKEVIQTLKDKYAIYMLANGRINIAGLNANNMEYVVDSIVKAFKEIPNV